MESTLSFVSIGCNAINGCGDWCLDSNQFCYAGNNQVVVFDPVQKTVVHTLKGHCGRVNCVKFACKDKIFSAASDFRVLEWRYDENKCRWEMKKEYKCFDDKSVICLDVVRWGSDEYVFAASIEKKIVVIKNGEIMQEVRHWSLVENLRGGVLPNSQNLFFVVGGSNNYIDFYVLDKEKNSFIHQNLKLKGHEDWVRCFDFISFDNNNVMYMSSGSQDNKIRIWRIQKQQKDEKKETNLFSQPMELSVGQNRWTVRLETILKGHEGFVTCLRWNKSKKCDSLKNAELLSSSLDRTIAIWGSSAELGDSWTTKFRMGSFSGLTGMFAEMGTFGAYFNKDGTQILTHGYNGCLESYIKVDGKWHPEFSLSGHLGPVKSAVWDPLGSDFFLTSSLDKTARIYGLYKKNDEKKWFELSRPQIHGYELRGAYFIESKKDYVIKYVSAGAEKQLRIYSSPSNVLKNIKNLTSLNYDVDKILKENSDIKDGAFLPGLSLTSKGVNEDEISKVNECTFRMKQFSEPPKEQDLLQHTLWVEEKKLFGHINPVISIGYNPKHNVVFSTDEVRKNTSLRVWDIGNVGKEQCKEIELLSETKRFTKMKPSNSGDLMLGSTVDRKIMLFEKIEGTPGEWKNCLQLKNAHKKTIWSCAWVDGSDDKFLTCSRDKSVKMWKLKKEKESYVLELLNEMKMEDEVTAVVSINEFIIVGLKNGNMRYLKDDFKEKNIFVDDGSTHSMSVNELDVKKVGDNEYMILSCSEDFSVRVFNVKIKK